MARPPVSLPKKLKVAAPTMAARKNSRRSTPQIVSGLLMDLQRRRQITSFDMLTSRKKPSHKAHRANGHTDSENDPSQRPFGITFAEGKHEAADHNGHQAQPSCDRTRKRLAQYVNGILPRRIGVGGQRRH